MTVKEFNKKLDDQLKKIGDAKFLLTCVSEVHSRQVNRIFIKGLNGNNAKIGEYSTKPMLASKGQFTKEGAFKQSFLDRVTGDVVDRRAEDDVPFWLTFKNKKTGVRNKKATPIMFIDGGYKEFRRIQGKEDSFVNLRYKGDLQSDFTNSLTLEGRVYKTGVKRFENGKKIEGLIKKYGEATFLLTQNEKVIYNECLKKKVLDTLNN